MKNRILRASMVMGLVLAGSAVVAAPASATEAPNDPICTLNQNTWLRDAEHGSVLLTLTAGRGFRWHRIGSDIGTGVVWYYGHGAEAPWQDGWVPKDNLSGCYWP
ncbi:hypothetical protein [Micromonospora sagamiensis]|uniref:SH3 domain-containing protein n=1 Tax=Micromonospora sagamiensis TaxID=47875 RepID=A0A562WD54_9ACTN|nr:hypothetical protein [Micromonospora sagamiensis]TWJ28223.1 hypothetical protein JD81_01726 [Micromonospora sagamiensis]BCL12886.1 hypothetical protein GCM10017556_06250 [Micromonospora sagamiensis]